MFYVNLFGPANVFECVCQHPTVAVSFSVLIPTLSANWLAYPHARTEITLVHHTTRGTRAG
jgi:hypothetical protein